MVVLHDNLWQNVLEETEQLLLAFLMSFLKLHHLHGRKFLEDNPKFVDDSKTTIRLGLRDIVSVMNVFGCVDKNHTINEYTAIIGLSNKADPRLFEKKIKVYRCIQCRRYFMYSTDFENELLPFLRGDRNYVFTRFEYNGKFFSPPPITDDNRLSKESTLSKAGYHVGLNSTLSHRERMSILIFLF